MIMTFTKNAHMFPISPAQQWSYFMQNAPCFPRGHSGNWFVYDKCLYLSEKTEWTSQKNRRSCVCTMCWWLPICITHSTWMVPQAAHLSLKDRNSPQTMTALGKTQSMLSSEDFKQPILVMKERETHMLLWFGCSVYCEPVPSTEWGTGKCLKRKQEDTFIRLTEKQIHPLCFLKHISDLQISIEGYFHTSVVRSWKH